MAAQPAARPNLKLELPPVGPVLAPDASLTLGGIFFYTRLMDYRAHYSRLIAHAADRELTGYSEKHHIVPRCIGGTDDTDNLVRLTAREHFVAHQLLCKMYPGEHDLVFAFRMLSTANNGRPASRTHAWLRERMADAASANMKLRHKRNPEILAKGRANFTAASAEKQQATFAATMARPGVRERRSARALQRWENDVENKQRARDNLSERRALLNGRPLGRDTSKAVVQMFNNGFVVVEHERVKDAATFAGINRCTIRDYVKRGHPLWGYME